MQPLGGNSVTYRAAGARALAGDSATYRAAGQRGPGLRKTVVNWRVPPPTSKMVHLRMIAGKPGWPGNRVALHADPGPGNSVAVPGKPGAPGNWVAVPGKPGGPGTWAAFKGGAPLRVLSAGRTGPDSCEAGCWFHWPC